MPHSEKIAVDSRSMTRRILFSALAGIVVTIGSSGIAHAADETKTIGRVKVTTLRGPAANRANAVGEALTARFAPAAGKRLSDVRIVSIRPRAQEPDRFD